MITDYNEGLDKDVFKENVLITTRQHQRLGNINGFTIELKDEVFDKKEWINNEDKKTPKGKIIKPSKTLILNGFNYSNYKNLTIENVEKLADVFTEDNIIEFVDDYNKWTRFIWSLLSCCEIYNGKERDEAFNKLKDIGSRLSMLDKKGWNETAYYRIVSDYQSNKISPITFKKAVCKINNGLYNNVVFKDIDDKK